MAKLTQYAEEIISRYRVGQSARALAKEYDVSRSAIYNRLKTREVPQHHPPRHFTPELVSQIISDYKASHGKTSEVAKRFGVPVLTLRYLLHKHGAIMPPHERIDIRIPEDRAMIGYIAGIIDGEGSIYLHLASSQSSQQITVQVGNTDERLLSTLHNRVGGNMRMYDPINKVGRVRRNKHFGYWNVQGPFACYHLLHAILPFLIVKKQKALEVLNYVESKYPHFVSSLSTTSSNK